MKPKIFKDDRGWCLDVPTQPNAMVLSSWDACISGVIRWWEIRGVDPMVRLK